MVAIDCRFGAPTMASASPHYKIGFLRLWRRAEKQLACQTAGMGLPDGGWVESAMPQKYSQALRLSETVESIFIAAEGAKYVIDAVLQSAKHWPAPLEVLNLRCACLRAAS
jgi:hypothetical protein